jgi:ABC-type transport system substrate-binding protein
VDQYRAGGYGYKQPCVYKGVDGSLDIKDLGPGADAYTHNPREAKRLLEAAGHASGLTLQPFTVANRSATHLEWVQLVQGYLSDVGITVRLDVQEYATFIGGAYRGKYEVAGWDFYRLYSDGDQVYDMYHTQGDLNQNHVSDRLLDDLIVKQRRTLVLPERRKVLAEIQRYVAAQYYDILFPYNEQLSLWRPKLRGFRPSGWYDQGGVWLHCWLEAG